MFEKKRIGTLFGAWTISSGTIKKRGNIIGATEQLRRAFVLHLHLGKSRRMVQKLIRKCA